MLLSLPGVEGEAGQASVRASISSLFSWGQASDRAPGEGGQDEGYDGEGGERECEGGEGEGTWDRSFSSMNLMP